MGEILGNFFGKLFETAVDILTCMGYTIHVAGCGSVWLERYLREVEAASSNLVTPMKKHRRFAVFFVTENQALHIYLFKFIIGCVPNITLLHQPL